MNANVSDIVWSASAKIVDPISVQNVVIDSNVVRDRREFVNENAIDGVVRVIVRREEVVHVKKWRDVNEIEVIEVIDVKRRRKGSARGRVNVIAPKKNGINATKNVIIATGKSVNQISEAAKSKSRRNPSMVSAIFNFFGMFHANCYQCE